MSITISIVSHNHGVLATKLLYQLTEFPEVDCIIITYNLKNDNINYPISLSGKIVEVHNELQFCLIDYTFHFSKVVHLNVLLILTGYGLYNDRKVRSLLRNT